MLSRLRIQNFKAWKDTGEVRLAPLTVIFGTNSAGKSSLGHLLLALKQTAASPDRRRALHTGDDASLVDLGTFVESLHGRDRSLELAFTLDWKLEQPLIVQNPLKAETYQGEQLRLTSTLAPDPRGQPEVRRLHYALHDPGDRTPALSATLARGDGGAYTLTTKPYRLTQAPGRRWPLDPPEKFYRVSDRSLARYRNADFLADFALEIEKGFERLSYLGPLRDMPRRTYGWSGNTPESVGPRGEYAIAAMLAADAEGRKLSRGPRKKREPFSAFIARWLMQLGIIERFEVRPIARGRTDYEVRVQSHGGAAQVALPDVGFGVSQVLPALVQSFYCPPGSTVWMEQPEIHLHPQVQAGLADALISAVHAYEAGAPRGVQLIIETHSEHLLNRLQRRIAEEVLAPEDVAIYFAKPSRTGAELEALEVDRFGEISNWPEGFFGDEMADLVARTQAAARRFKKDAR